MIVNPAIIALIGGSVLTAGFAVYASGWGIEILRHWDLSSGSGRQLQLERRTHLISTIMAYLLALEIFSLLLFIYTADHLHPAFVGAMCAAGSLNVNDFGYPTLVVKMATVLLCGVWLMVNRCDNLAEDYPLIRPKYRLLLGVTALIVVGALLQISYFKHMSAHVITSCCGTLFSTEARSIAGTIAALPPQAMRVVFFGSLLIHLRMVVHLLVTGRGGRAVGAASALLFIVAILAVVSFISLYYYELPTHHCPFDLLQGHYHYVGYPLYVAIFSAGIAGTGIGVLARYAGVASLSPILPAMLKGWARVVLGANVATAVIAAYPMVFYDFRLVV
ncbi:MAG: hypothetical protein RBS34_06620 [Desulfofustis sp.]|jgi:hypothetical protein|nr:hypothetical protein [Desulfofustis sp.]